MTGLVTLRDPILVEPANLMDRLEPLPLADPDGHAYGWSYREATGLRFARWRARRGDFDGDRFGLVPEPLPACHEIDPIDGGRNDR